MRVSPALAISVAVLTACAASAPGTSAGAATSGSPYGAESAGARAAMAAVTDIREVVNQLPEEVWLSKGEDQSVIWVEPSSRATDSMWIPWVGNEGEMGKSIAVHRHYRVLYWIFQDYWSTTNQVRYSTTNSYRTSAPVPGNSTGGGRKRLSIRSDGTPFMENAS
ncbi:hypothetical protein [Microbispora sp. NPDC046933]|uniref:hypothetical protein n=1 Tax=Microbispora sp. NPDC046933 TaxID=3155618 RepID=UPI0033CF33E4